MSEDIFAGMTRGKCADGCRPDKCLSAIFSQRMTTYHGKKPEVVERFERAQELLRGPSTSRVA
jgi:hypothetical protein